MFIHLGGNTIIDHKSIIAIFGLKAVEAVNSRYFIRGLKDESRLQDISLGFPKSLVLTDEKAFLSPISPSALKRRTFFSNEWLYK